MITRRVAIQNHLRAIVQREGILLDRGGRAWTAAGFEVIQEISKPLEQCSEDELWRGEAALELQALEAVTKLLREVERKLEVLAASNESVKLLRSILGVGRCTAEVVVTNKPVLQSKNNEKTLTIVNALSVSFRMAPARSCD